MNTSQLSYILRTNPVTKRAFTGVYAADQIVKSANLPSAYVVNTDCAGEPGSHWIAFYQENKNVMDFFDSFGRPITAFDENIQNFFKGLNLCCQDLPLHSPYSTT